MTASDGIQILSTALAALAAGAAWVAAKATRDSARATRSGNLIQSHVKRCAESIPTSFQGLRLS